MNYKIDSFNLYLNLDKYNVVDSTYYQKYQPYRYNATTFLVPLTLKSLNDFVNHFQIDINAYQDLLTAKIHLQALLKFHYLPIQTQHEYLRDYQYQGVLWTQQRLKHIDSVGLFWEPRTGKTRTTTIASLPYKKIVVVSLAGQETNWINNYQQFSQHQIFSLFKQTKQKRISVYEAFNNANCGVLVGSMNTIANDLLNNMKLKQFDIVIIDEIHKIKNFKTRLNKGLKQLIKYANKIIGLTGTPASKNESEVLNIISFLFKGKLSKTYLADYFFEKEWNNFSQYASVGSLKESKQQEWIEFLSLYFSKVDKSIALPWINTPEIEIINLNMYKKQKQLYERCLYHLEVPIGNEVKQLQEIISQFTYLRQISTHPNLIDNDNDSIKQDWLLDFLTNYDGDGVIVFSNHTRFLENLYNIIPKKYHPLIITGKTKDKTQIANAFLYSNSKVVLANINAASKGITLDKADTIIFLDIDWRPDENKQAIERFSATTKENEKFRKVIYLQIADEFIINNRQVLSIDKYMWLVNQNKITQTELINNFKDIYKDILEQC